MKVSARRVLLMWLALPAALALGAGAGLLAAGWANHGTAAETSTHAGHGATDAHAGHGAGDVHDGSDAHGTRAAEGDDAHGNHGSHVMPDGSTMSDDVAMSTRVVPTPTTVAPTAADHDGHAAYGGAATPTSGSRTAVLAGFVVLNIGVLGSAAVLRRRVRDRRLRRFTRTGFAG